MAKTQTILTLAEAEAILVETKITVREMEWVAKAGEMPVPWLIYESACEVKSEVREDIMLIALYRAKRNEVSGKAAIVFEEQLAIGLLASNCRIFAIDKSTTKHTNKVGKGLPYYGHTFSAPHKHFWTNEGYGYAEPLANSSAEIEELVADFLVHTNISLTGDFVHPLKGQQGFLL